MNNQALTRSNTFCWNKECPEYGKINPENIRNYGNTKKGTHRYQCKTCKKVFVETIGTVFYGIKHSIEEVLECFALLAERNSLASIHRITGIKEETVANWLLKAEENIEKIETLLLVNYKISKMQLDALWSYVGNKGEKKWAYGNSRSRNILDK